MLTSSRLLWLALVMAAAGLLLVYAFPGDGGTFTFGYYGNDDGRGLPLLLFMTTRRVIGAVLVWLATMIVAGVIGHRMATRPERPS